MYNYKHSSFKLLGIILVISCLTACGGEKVVTQGQMVKNNAQIILDGIESKTYEPTAELFSPYVKENYPTLHQDIAELMEYIDGEIVSYSHLTNSNMGGHTTAEEGWVEKYFEGVINDVKTSTDRTYEITFAGYYVYKEEPKKVGLDYLLIECLDDLDEDGEPVRKSFYYE